MSAEAPSPRPPHWLEWLLRICLPRGVEGQTLRGDLIEEFRIRAAEGDGRAARRWCRRQGLGLALHFAARRVRLLAPPFGHDLRLAGRSLIGHASLTLTVVLLVGVSLGSNTALFSIFDGLLFRPLPYRDAERIVHMTVSTAAMSTLRGPERDAIRQQERASPLLAERAHIDLTSLFDVAGPAVQAWQLRPAELSHTAFGLLGIRPYLGRPFVEEDSAGQPFAVLLGYDIWTAHFGADPGIVGRDVTIPGTSERDRWHVVGVMPSGFSFPVGANVWIPRYPGSPSPLVTPYARLASGATLEQVQAALPAVTITPLRAHVRPDGAIGLGVLLSGTTLLFMLALVQVAALLFARASSRAAEIGVRLALGASRLRLVRQFGVEALLLISMSLIVGTLAAPLLTTTVVRILPPELTLGQSLAPDIRAYLFGSGLAIAGLVILTLLPTDLIRRSNPISLLRGGRSGAAGRRVWRVRTALFVCQLAVATCIIHLSGLALRSYSAIGRSPLGFDPADIVAIRMPRQDGPVKTAPGESRRGYLDAQREMVAQTLQSLKRLPEVATVSGAHTWPLQLGVSDLSALPAELDPNRRLITGRTEWIVPNYPATLGLRLLSGAEPDFGVQETAGRQTARPIVYHALVNESLARQLRPFGDPVGQRLVPNMSLRFHITGIVPDVRLGRPGEAPVPTAFVYLPAPAAPGVVLARLQPNQTGGLAAIQTAVDRIWGDRAPRAFPLEEAVKTATTDYRARMVLLNLIGIVAISLTVIGVAGALTYATRQRTKDIAIELAIGAEPGVIERRLVKQALRATALALTIGLSAGVGVGQVISSSFFGVGAADPVTLLMAALVITLVAWAAALAPARRAGRINPAEALRET